jgi:hypothetical protein
LNKELIQTFQWFREFGYYNGEDISETKKIYPHMTTFEQWLQKSGWVAK